MKQIKAKLENETAAPAAGNCAPKPAPSGSASSSNGASASAGKAFSSDYNGVPYDTLVKTWMAQRGLFGEVAEGARNTTLYQLARDMRYLMDFNVEFMFQRLPHWGLTDEEARSVFASAVSSARGTELPPRVAALVSGFTTPTGDEPPTATVEKNPLPKRLPPLLDLVARRYPLFPKAAVLASLPALGTLLSQLRSKYADGRVQSPIFFVVVQAPQASGKSFARELSDWLVQPIRENDQLERQREQEYKEKLKTAKNAKEQPQDPHAVVRCLPATVSNAVLLKRADAAHELALYTFAEEIDTIVRSNKSGAWSQKNDIYRMAFDGAEWGQDYMSDNSYSAVVKLHYNLLFLGTPLAVSSFFKKVEDGMASRFVLAHLPDNRGEALQRPVPMSVGQRNRMTALIRRAYEEGSQKDEIPVTLPKTLHALDAWQLERIKEYDREPDNFALDILRRRAAVIGFRAGMLAWWLCERKETAEVVDFALWVASEVLQQQLVAFGEAMNQIERESLETLEEHERKARRSRNGNLLRSLSETFTKNDVIVARKRLGWTGECGYVISRWLKAGLIAESEDYKSYVKLEKANESNK